MSCAEMPPCVFAAAVPNNYNRVVKDLVTEVYADHNAMVSNKKYGGQLDMSTGRGLQ